MCEAAEAEPAVEDEKASVLDDLSPGNAEILEQIKGLTLLEASALIKEVESTFNVGPKSDDDDAEADE